MGASLFRLDFLVVSNSLRTCLDFYKKEFVNTMKEVQKSGIKVFQYSSRGKMDQLRTLASSDRLPVVSIFLIFAISAKDSSERSCCSSYKTEKHEKRSVGEKKERKKRSFHG
jgi:hypothetical protein